MCMVLFLRGGKKNTLWYFSETPQFYFYDVKEELIGQEFDQGSVGECPILS